MSYFTKRKHPTLEPYNRAMGLLRWFSTEVRPTVCEPFKWNHNIYFLWACAYDRYKNCCKSLQHSTLATRSRGSPNNRFTLPRREHFDLEKIELEKRCGYTTSRQLPFAAFLFKISEKRRSLYLNQQYSKIIKRNTMFGLTTTFKTTIKKLVLLECLLSSFDCNK